MLIDPEKNKEFKNFLNFTYKEIEFLLPKFSLHRNLRDEFKWSAVLTYFLLKTLGTNILQDYVSKGLSKIYESYDNYKVLIETNLSNPHNKIYRHYPEVFQDFYNSFFDTYLVNPYILEFYLYQLRTALELKVLFILFGGKFLPQKLEFSNGKGALCFNKNDFKGNSMTYLEKINIIEEHLKSKDNEISCIAVNLGMHWTALNSIKDNSIILNDPASGRTKRIKINKRVPSTYSFYLFKYNPRSAYILKNEVREFIEEETEKELKNLKKFLKSLTEVI
ncbi:MAG: hypothetical protein ACP6IY_02295 [Promethearchaeia archaeon]